METIGALSSAGKPFLLSLHFSAPHWPWEGPDDEAEAQRLAKIGGPSLIHLDGGTMATYAEMVVAMDRAIGRVLEALKANGVAGDTIVIFTSDNGGERFSNTWPFTGKKTELLEGGLRVPLIIHWPGVAKPGHVSAQTAITMDFTPTLLAAAGAAPHPDYPTDGIDLRAAIEGAAPQPRRLFFRYLRMQQRAYRKGDWKYLRIMGNTFLFDVANDPLERANLKSRHRDVFDEMAAEYEAWEATMLPLDPSAHSHGFSPRFLADHFAAPD